MPGRDPRRTDDGLLSGILSGLDVKAAAAVAGVSERHARRRVADPAFRQRLAAARAEQLSQATNLLMAASREAIETLRSLLSARSESVRLMAAKAILETGFKATELVELEARLAALESAAPEPPAHLREVV